MTVRMGAREARTNFAELLGRVKYGGETFIVERSGKAMAALVPVELYERWLAEREKAFRVIDRIWSEQPDVDPAEIEADITEALEAVRADARRSGHEHPRQ